MSAPPGGPTAACPSSPSNSPSNPAAAGPKMSARSRLPYKSSGVALAGQRIRGRRSWRAWPGRIARHRLRRFFELLFGIRLGTDVRMVAAGQLAERVLDGRGVRIGRHAEHLVVVTAGGHGSPPPPRPAAVPSSRPHTPAWALTSPRCRAAAAARSSSGGSAPGYNPAQLAREQPDGHRAPPRAARPGRHAAPGRPQTDGRPGRPDRRTGRGWRAVRPVPVRRPGQGRVAVREATIPSVFWADWRWAWTGTTRASSTGPKSPARFSAEEASMSTAQDTGRAHALMADDTKVEIR